MKVLLDTHAMLWFCLDDARLSNTARSIIADSDNDLLVSPATLWEIAIKISLKKYTLQGEFAAFFKQQIKENGFLLLPITVEHAAIVARFPFHHRDPFDRFLAAQSVVEQVPILSTDPTFDLYSVPRIW